METASSLSLSADLERLTADQVEGFSGGPHGYDVRPKRWQPPAVISADVREEARASLGAVAPLCEPAKRAVVATWVAKLGAMAAGRMSADEAQVKVELLSSELCEEYPVGVFTPETLRAAARAFKWFPSYAELAEQLDIEARKLKRLRERLETLARPATPQPPTREQSTVRAAIRPMPGVRKSDAVKAEPKPEKASAIVQPPSAEQLAEWAKACGVPA